MKLTFLGTRGNIEAKTDRHRRHASTLFEYWGRGVQVDCGEDWLGLLDELAPRAIVLTHAHPDHAFGLKGGAPCPVWGTAETWEGIGGFPIGERHTVEHRRPFEVEGITFEAFPVDHSVRAPAVGYRVSAGVATVFYVPDVVSVPDRAAALGDADLYVGDGATVERSIVRRMDDDTLIGHTPVRTQLTWCGEEGVPRAIFTHCGSRIVEGDERSLGPKVRGLGQERGVEEAEIADDGMEVMLR